MVKHSQAGALLPVTVARQRGLPLGRQVAHQIRELIRSGRLPAGSRLPSTRTLARELGVSRNTLLDAFETLAAEGYIAGRVGAGSYVVSDLPDEGTVVPSHALPRSAATPAPVYPFRRLSARGRRLVDGAADLPEEAPRAFSPDRLDVRCFPFRLWMRLMSESAGRLAHGQVSGVTNAGYEPLRRAIANHVAIARGVRCSWEQVVVTTGSQQSHDLLVRLLIDHGDSVWIGDPAYVGIRNALRAGGAAIRDLSCDAGGFPIERAIDTLATPRLIAVAPSSQYPLNTPLSEERRAHVAQYAARTGVWVIEDDYDGDFVYFGPHTPAVQAFDRSHRVFFTGTFSKLLLPSFRLGYIVVPPDLVADVIRARTQIDRHAPLMEQMALAEFMERGHFASHIRRVREACWRRQGRLREALTAATAGRVHLPAACVGTNLAMHLSGDVDDKVAAAQAERYGVVVRPLSTYACRPLPSPALMLGYGAFLDDEIDDGAMRLAPVLADLV